MPHLQAGPLTCRYKGCGKPSRYWKLCAGHATQKSRGRKLTPLKPKLGWTIQHGYKILSLPGGVRIAEHRYVMAKKLGRALLPSETVHHKDGNRRNNRLRNLELWTKAHPYGQRVRDLIRFARQLLKRYGYTVKMRPCKGSAYV